MTRSHWSPGNCRRPSIEAAPASAAFLGPPERLFGLENHIAPGKADVVQVAVGPLGQLAAGLIAAPPDVESFAQLAQKTGNMMICHQFMGAGRHFWLLRLICCRKYLRNAGFPQTTLCTASHEINSCIWNCGNDRQAALAQWTARLRGRGPASEFYAGRVRAERDAGRDQPSDQTAGGRARGSPVRPPEPRADLDAGGERLPPRDPRRVQRYAARHRPPAAQGR